MSEELNRKLLQEGNIIKIHRLLERGADVNAQNEDGWTILTRAVDRNDYDLVNLLLAYNPNAHTIDQALQHVCQQNWRWDNCTQALLTKGVEVSGLKLSTKRLGELLSYTSRNISLQIPTLLLSMGADVNYTDEKNWTALMFACEHGCRGVMKLLLEHKPDLMIRNHKNQTALDIAIASNYKDSNPNGHKEMVEILAAATQQYELDQIAAVNHSTELNVI